jgi:succinoglycan biosynthesis transport protein ExoP
MAQETGLPELIDALRWRWKLIVLIAIAVFAGAAFYVENLPNEYEGEALVAYSPRPNVTSANADTVRITLPRYVEFVTAPSTVEEVAEELDEDPETIGKSLDAQNPSESGNLVITSRLRSTERAADVANAFAEAAVDESLTDRLLNADLIAEALPSSAPAGPPRRLLEGAALLVGLALGIAVSFLLERGRPRLHSWREIASLTGYSMLGKVPDSRILRTRPWEAFADPQVGAAFRTLRTNLESRLTERTPNIVVVTSPSKGDGKTTVAALFAEALARLGLRVLLLDADLRRPGVSKTFRFDPSPGMSETLRGESSIDSAIRDGWVDNLWVLPTKGDPDAGDLLATRFADIMRDIGDKYDAVVADTPPLLGTDDARTLAAMANGVLLVVSSKTLVGTVSEAVLSLETLNAPVLGVIGNRVRESRRSTYYG